MIIVFVHWHFQPPRYFRILLLFIFIFMLYVVAAPSSIGFLVFGLFLTFRLRVCVCVMYDDDDSPYNP